MWLDIVDKPNERMYEIVVFGELVLRLSTAAPDERHYARQNLDVFFTPAGLQHDLFDVGVEAL